MFSSHKLYCYLFVLSTVIISSECQENETQDDSLRPIKRMLTPVPPGRTADISDTYILFYSNSGNTTAPNKYYLNETQDILSASFYDPDKPVALYAHGFIELTTDESVQYVLKSYQQNGGYNILILDWSNLAFGNYITDINNVKIVGIALGNALADLLNAGLSIDKLHLIGHSMGAHVVAGAGKTLAKLNYTVKRITGLDPAFPGFYLPLLLTDVALSSSDGEFVQSIHTNGGQYGTPYDTGKADFWPNGGQGKQPGCPILTVPLTSEDFCSHWRSWRYWGDSLTGANFLARQCDGHKQFQWGLCNSGQIVPMGVNADPSKTGNFYLRTASQPPYDLGENGASP